MDISWIEVGEYRSVRCVIVRFTIQEIINLLLKDLGMM